MTLTEQELQRFLSKIDVEGDCWLWTGALAGKGYGHLKLNGKNVYAHRLMYELCFGPIPEGKWVLHSCDTPPCCNPDHFFLGDPVDNHDDMYVKGRSGRAVLSKEEIEEAKAMWNDGLTQREIAVIFGKSYTQMRRYLKGNVL